MNAQEWLRVGEYALEASGSRGNFRAVEIAPVGRVAQRGGKKAILQAPPAPLFRNALLLRDLVLEPLRAAEGVAALHITSWFRDPDYNALIGGATESIHMTGGAADVFKAGWHPLRVALWLHHRHPQADKLGIGYYAPRPPNPSTGDRGGGGFVHVDVRGLIAPLHPPARFPGTGWFQQRYQDAPGV